MGTICDLEVGEYLEGELSGGGENVGGNCLECRWDIVLGGMWGYRIYYIYTFIFVNLVFICVPISYFPYVPIVSVSI